MINLTYPINYTYISGFRKDKAKDIHIDEEHNVYLTGITFSGDFVTSKKCNFGNKGNGQTSSISASKSLDSTNNGDAFLIKISSTEDVDWVSYMRGDKVDESRAISVDKKGNIYIAGYTYSPDFPVKKAFDEEISNGDAFISKFDNKGELIWSTFLGGGSWNEGANDIVIDENEYVFVVGWTSSDDFPYAINQYNGGCCDGYISKLDCNGRLIWSRYIGGEKEEEITGVQIDEKENVYLTGWTNSLQFPTQVGYQMALKSIDQRDSFLSMLDKKGEIIWSTYFGGSSGDEAFDIAYENDGYIYITGRTRSHDLPKKGEFFMPIDVVKTDLFSPKKNYSNNDAFIAKFNTKGDLIWNTYLGGENHDESQGICTDDRENIFIAGWTKSTRKLHDFKLIQKMENIDGKKDSPYGIFLSKFRNDGFLYWTKLITLKSGTRGQCISNDDQGNVYISGYITLREADYETEEDIFLFKYNDNQ